MPFEPRPEDWSVLGLKPGAELREVRRSYHQRRALYADGGTAAYNLLEDDERHLLLEKIEEAYQRITGIGSPPPTAVHHETEELAVPSGPPPDASEQPGAHLRHHRLLGGLSLAQVADETKIRASLLGSIEDQAFQHLPATVYVRGFVLQYARLLDIADPEGLVATYLKKMMVAQAAE